MEDIYPAVGQEWEHRRNGTKYEVVIVGNTAASDGCSEDFRTVQVGYRGTDGESWVTSISAFVRRMKYNKG